jgi:uridine kinase
MFDQQPDLDAAVQRILQGRTGAKPNRALLVGVSGIDGSGKGFVANRIVRRLLDQNIHAVVVHGDGWLNLPERRFQTNDPARHFYENAFRMDTMFEELVLPLKKQRSHTGVMDFVDETATASRLERYAFEKVDVIVLECIYLFKPAYRRHFDVAIWIECSFETALERAIHRAQEGLAAAETIRAYETIYFPAQRIHFDNDRPREAADVIVSNG